jgi:adenylate cyclase
MPPRDSKQPTKVAAELQHLQSACKSMRGAIKSWSKYVPPAVVQRLFASGVEAQIGVAKVHVTILFCDIAGFEDACRGLSPEEVLHLLEQVMTRIADVISRNRGTLLEFIGDEVLAVFNAPNTLKNHTSAGVSSALEIHTAVSTMPSPQTADGREIPIRCRCGVNTCIILAGNIGSSQRLKYGLLGDGINLTARLKGINSRYQTRTLASDKVYADERCRRSVVFRPVDLVAVKGKKEPTAVYEPLIVRSKDDPSPLEQAAEKHSKAFSYYKERKFDEAMLLFEEVQLIFESDGTSDEASRMLKLRCQRYKENPPPDDWDGVERLTKK